MFKAVLVTMSKVPFKLEPDIPANLQGRIRWARRNYEFHKAKAENHKKRARLTFIRRPPIPITCLSNSRKRRVMLGTSSIQLRA